MTSKFAQAIFNHIQTIKTFTSRDLIGFFPNTNFQVIKDAVSELLSEKKIFKYGKKRGTFYSIKEDLNENEDKEELHPILLNEIEKFVLTQDTFTSSDIFSEFPTHPEHVIRKILIHLRDEKEIIHMHGYGKGSIWSKHEILPKIEENEPEEKIDIEIKEQILNFAKENQRWFRRSELDVLFEDITANEIRQILFNLEEDGEIIVRGERRSTEYGYYKLIENYSEENEEETEEKADIELKNNILIYIKEIGIVTVPELIKKFETQRKNIIVCLKELEDEEEIYHEGIKKSSKYIYKDVTQDKIEKTIKEKKIESTIIHEKEKSIDKLSELLQNEYNIYLSFINSSNKYELRSCNILYSGINTLTSSENPEDVINYLNSLLILKENNK